LAVVNEQLFLVKHDGMALGKVGHATAHNNWSPVPNMRRLTEVPNNTLSVSARQSEEQCKYLSEINLMAVSDRTSLVIFGVRNRALQHGTQRSHRGALLWIIQAAVPSFAALAISASASPAGFFNCAAHWQQCYIL